MSLEKENQDSINNNDQSTQTGENENSLPVVGQLTLLSCLLLLIFGGTITPKIISLFEVSGDEQVLAVEENGNISNETFGKKAFSDITLTAKSAYVWDIENQKVLFKKNESNQRPLASITKLMTALVAQEILGEDEMVEIDALSLKQDGSSGFREGEVVSRMSLNDMVLMSSSNDGAFALALKAGERIDDGANSASTFVDVMNIRAKEMGLNDTYFKNPTGLDLSPSEGGAYGSARDVAFLMEYILTHEPDILSFTKENVARFFSETGEYHDAQNTNDYVNSIPGLIGSKTGYTDLAGGNLVVAWSAGLNRPIVAVVLGSTAEERFLDVQKLVEETQSYILTNTR